MAESASILVEIERLQGSVPEYLQAYPQFVYWKPVAVQGKVKKLPFNPHTGELASPTNPATWGSFADALRAYGQRDGKGIGFTFSDNDPFAGIDLDHCMENTGEIAPWAQQILNAFNSYKEVSQSGTGIH